METLGEYFGDLLTNHRSQGQVNGEHSKAEQSDPFAGFTQRVKNLIHTVNTLGANSEPQQKGLISKIDDRTLSYLHTLFTECLSLQKRGLSAELKPLLSELKLEQTKRGERVGPRQAPPTQTFG